MKEKDKKKLLYNYKIELIESKWSTPVLYPDNTFKTMIPIDEAIKILNKMIKTEE